VLDIFHASEHLHAAAVALHGPGAAAEAWYAARRRTLLGSGAAGLLAEVASEAGDVTELVGYLTPHLDHTAYRRRLAEGRSIGSGMVEGACKTAIGRRLEQAGVRWRIRRLERMAALCCLHYGDQFDACWKQAAR
jgi:C4-dicarboxylate-specific signal transduction histidine kinase